MDQLRGANLYEGVWRVIIKQTMEDGILGILSL